MSDLISRQAAIEALIDAGIVNYDATGDGNGMIHAINVIKGLPSAEPEIIQCRDCKYWAADDDDDERAMYCEQEILPTILARTGDGYCSFAERKENDTE